MKRMRVCVVTGSRAEFGIWRPVLGRIKASKVLELKLVVTGMHLLKGFGETVKEIEKEFEMAARVAMFREARSQKLEARSQQSEAAASLARGIEGLARAYREVKADLVMVLGDRLEMLAAASAALAGRIPIGHVHGGETAPGVWDEQIRHAITKMAQVHFCSTLAAKRRICAMGEDPARVHQVGAPALDTAVEFMRRSRRIIPQLRLVSGTQPLLLLHPSSSDDKLEYQRTLMLIETLQKTFDGTPVIHAIGPNNDPGHQGILKAYVERQETVRLEMSLSQQKFWVRMLSSGLLVGNSSSGIIEAATFGIPVINLGGRQAGRERSANVIDVGWEEGELGIEQAVRRVLTDKAFLRRVALRKNVYGDGRASERIVRVLEGIAREGGLKITKQFVD